MARDHARFSPSQLDGLTKCLRFKFDRTKEMDEAADEGSLLHHAAEKECMTGLDDNQLRDVAYVLEYVEKLKEGCSPYTFDLKEPRLVLHELTWGHADRVIVDVGNKTVHLVDYKFTRVENDHSFQLRTYAAAVVEMLKPEYGLLVNDTLVYADIQMVKTYVIAPRLGKTDVETFEDAAQLVINVREEISELYARIDDPFLPANPGHPELCARCARCAVCPEVNKTIALVAPRMGLPMPDEFAPDAIVSLADRSLAQKLAPLLEKWAEQVKRNNTEFVKNGGEVPGFKMTTRNGGFMVPRESTLSAVDLLAGLDISATDVLSAAKLSVPELAGVVATNKGGTVDDWKAQIIDRLLPVGTQSVSQYLTKVSKKELK